MESQPDADSKVPLHGPGKLTKEQLAKVIAFFTERFGTKTCDICGHGRWTINETLSSPMILDQTNGEVTGINFQQALITITATCDNCGNTNFFALNRLNALGLSIVEAAP